MPGKRVQFDDETWQAVDVLARDSMKSFQELADEAFSDLLKKHGRPTDLKSALRQSADQGSAVGQSREKSAASAEGRKTPRAEEMKEKLKGPRQRPGS
jgi:hypothetical protein